MASMADVARLAGVSTATVSRYLNDPETVKEHTRNKVKNAISQTHYSPNILARNFRRGSTSLIAVMLPRIGDPFFTEVMAGITKVAKEKHYSILVKEIPFRESRIDEISDMIISKQLDGVILLAATSPFKKHDSHSASEQLPPIVLACENVTPGLEQLPSVRIDNIAAARDATGYLIGLGHKKIGFIFGKSTSTLTLGRERGYRKAMQESNLHINKDWVQEGNLTLDGAREATRNLLRAQPRPTAIFCANDEMAIAALHEIKFAGLKVPQDISLMGFDDIRYAEVMDPPLTTIAQPAAMIGEKIMSKLYNTIEGRTTNPPHETVAHTLVVRKSTAPPREK